MTREPPPELCHHDDPSWCNKDCEAKAKRFDEWVRNNLKRERSMTRELTGHQVNPANDVIKIVVADEKGAGGAHHRYELTGFDTSSNPSAADHQGYTSSFTRHVILFQNGPIAEAGVNGLTHEALLAILIDRMECFQAGAYASDDNQIALGHMRGAQEALLNRTRKRMARGVEGTHAK